MHGRFTSVTPPIMLAGTGLLTLKEKNLLMLNKKIKTFDVPREVKN